MKKTILIFIFSLNFISISNALDLSGRDAERLALNHSYELKQSQSESAAYHSNLKAARAERYPNLSLEAKALYNSEISQLDLEIPGFSLVRDISQHEIYQTDLRIGLPLYTGGKISSTINIARANLEIRQALIQKSSDEIKFMAKQEYLRLYKSDKLVDAAQSSLKRTGLVKEDIHSLYKVGLADSVQLFEIELSYNMALLAMDKSTNNRRRQEIVLSVLLGLSTDESIRVSTPPQSPKEFNRTKISIDANKPELLTARSMISINQSLVKLNRSAYAPNLNLFTGYSYGKPNISPFEEDFNGYFTVGASLNWSLNLGGKTKSKLSMAQSLLKSSRLEYNRVHEQITTQAKLTFENLKLAYSSYKTSLKSFEITKSNFRLAQIKYREGVMSANHLLDIETNLSQAESMLYTTEADYHLVLNQYNFITGHRMIKEGN